MHFKEETIALLKHHLCQLRRDQALANTPSPLCTTGQTDVKMPSFTLIIDGHTLHFALQSDVEKLFLALTEQCESVVCCRTAPRQKVC